MAMYEFRKEKASVEDWKPFIGEEVRICDELNVYRNDQPFGTLVEVEELDEDHILLRVESDKVLYQFSGDDDEDRDRS